MLRHRRLPPKDVFPANPWALEAIRFDSDLAERWVGQTETMFALANGFIGVRGAWDEGVPAEEPGTYLNGFYENRPIAYGESAYGFPREGQSMLNVPDGAVMKLSVDDEPFVLTEAEVLDTRRVLDFRAGTLYREVVWRTRLGKTVRLRTRRFVSCADRHLVAIDYEIVVEDADAQIAVSSELLLHQPLTVDATDPRLAAGMAGRVLHGTGQESAERRVILSFVTEGSGLSLGCGMDHALETEGLCFVDIRERSDGAAVAFDMAAQRGRPLRIRKFLAYHYDRLADPEDVRARAARTLDRARRDGFDRALARHEAAVRDFWARSDVAIETGDPRDQQIVRWNLFQLLQATERAEGHGVGARGLTGRTYEGHYFWDTEIYVLPFLVYTNPRMARSLLKFRYDMLDKARDRATELGHRGATFPWRTIDGREASAYYAAGTAQYHINADIAYAVCKYVEVTDDREFLRRFGVEILIETARFWCDLGFFSARRGGEFVINGVTGPDEYNAVVDNNFFTNLMAQQNLRAAATAVATMLVEAPGDFEALSERVGLREDEPANWTEAANRMHLPFDERLKVHPQDDNFLDKEPWDFANTPEDRYPLLLHYHPLNLYRAQVIKQADTLLAMFLLGEGFTPEEKKRNFDFYDPLTTHDSSLSVSIQSIVANEIGYREKALDYFTFAAAMDLSDVGGNMRHGAHIASIGGCWMALAYGFAGLRDWRGRISFAPRLPPGWSRLRLPLTIRGARIELDATPDRVRYTLAEGEEATFASHGETVALSSASPVVEQRSRRPAA